MMKKHHKYYAVPYSLVDWLLVILLLVSIVTIAFSIEWRWPVLPP